ncbi:hypothetical protein DIZ76_016666 [Coccidioides immitis]|nr:hypothetical protein DIZ76_016666 [Coccidioides immitis]
MRGIGILGETVGSQICPSCLWRIASQNASGGPPRGPLEFFRSVSTLPRRPLVPSSRRKRSASLKWRIGIPAAVHGNTTAALPSESTLDFDPFTLGKDIESCNGDQLLNHNPVQQTVVPPLDIDAILEEAQPGRILAGLTSSPEFQQAVSQLPAATFSEVIRLLSPEYFIEPSKELLSHLHPTTAYVNRILPLSMLMARFAEQLETIVEQRRYAGHRLGLAEYTHLLSCAASMGYGRMAHRFWEEMAEDGIEPTVECYNYLMEAKAWDGGYVAKENHRVRSTVWNYEKRKRWPSNPGYKGFKTGKGGVRDQVHGLFSMMVESGLNPNEATFIHVMTAAGREWDMESVKTTLRTVWGIDVDLLEKDPASHPPVTVYAVSSPLHPTSHSLFAVAHIFGSNNEFATALKLVDFISQSYHIPIPQRVWQELLEWSFVLSVDRFGENLREKSVGMIPRDSAHKLFDVFTSSPYNTPANFKMYDLVIKLGWMRQSKDRTFRYMHAAREHFLQTLKTRNQLFHKLSSMHKEIMSTKGPYRTDNSSATGEYGSVLSEPAYDYRLTHLYPSVTSPGAYWDLYNTVKHLNVTVARESLRFQRWIRLVLTRRKWTGSKARWERQGIPDFIAEWKEFLPRRVFYHTRAGIVEFDPVSLWPEGHRWDLANFMLPLWDAENRLIQGYGESHQSQTTDDQENLNDPATCATQLD